MNFLEIKKKALLMNMQVSGPVPTPEWHTIWTGSIESSFYGTVSSYDWVAGLGSLEYDITGLDYTLPTRITYNSGYRGNANGATIRQGYDSIAGVAVNTGVTSSNSGGAGTLVQHPYVTNSSYYAFVSILNTNKINIGTYNQSRYSSPYIYVRYLSYIKLTKIEQYY